MDLHSAKEVSKVFLNRIRPHLVCIWVLVIYTITGCSNLFDQPVKPDAMPDEEHTNASQGTISTVIPSTSTPTYTAIPSITPSATSTQTVMPSMTAIPQLNGDIALVLREDNSVDDIYILNLEDDSDIRPLTDEGLTNINPAWSPLGNEIAFVSDRIFPDGGTFDLYVTSIDGNVIDRLTNDLMTSDRFPSWSPDGKKIALTTDYFDGTFNSDIIIINRDGSNRYPITNSELPEEYPSWSPTGNVIAFLYQENVDIYQSFVYLINIDGSDRHKLTSIEARGKVSWSPDGQRLAFPSHRDIYIINVDGSNGYYLTGEDDYLSSPTWSPDGNYIAFRDPNNDLLISIMDLYGNIIKKISVDPNYGYKIIDISWSRN